MIEESTPVAETPQAQPKKDFHTSLREKFLEIRKGKVVVANDEVLDQLIIWAMRSNLNLEVVFIPNPNSVCAEDVYLAGYISAPEIEQYRLERGIETQEEVDLLRAIAKVSGYTMTEVYSHREVLPMGTTRAPELQQSLDKWNTCNRQGIRIHHDRSVFP